MQATRRREWILEIEYRQRELFAFACEFYSRILELGATRAERLRWLKRFAENPSIGEPIVSSAELLDVLTDAVNARNGWKRILARCERRSDFRGAGNVVR
jgi:hypothetical protein